MIKEHIEVFNKVLEREDFRYTGAQISAWSGFATSQVSRFLNGKTDLPVSKFFELLYSMPPRFQECYWSELLALEKKERDWREMIISASAVDVQDILAALSEWTSINNKKAVKI